MTRRTQVFNVAQVGIITPGGLVTVCIESIHIDLFFMVTTKIDLIFPFSWVFATIIGTPV